jgi:hypothetical protein
LRLVSSIRCCLGNQRLHMHRLEQADAHHLRDPARIIAVRLVDLLRR